LSLSKRIFIVSFSTNALERNQSWCIPKAQSSSRRDHQEAATPHKIQQGTVTLVSLAYKGYGGFPVAPAEACYLWAAFSLGKSHIVWRQKRQVNWKNDLGHLPFVVLIAASIAVFAE
jgi:hypothetical protein